MHKKLASDLTSLAHSILQMKNKEDIVALKEKAHEVYEKLALLAYVEEYINTTPQADTTKEALTAKIEERIILKEKSELEEKDKDKEEIIIHKLEEVIEEENNIEDTINEKIGAKNDVSEIEEQKKLTKIIEQENDNVEDEIDEELVKTEKTDKLILEDESLKKDVPVVEDVLENKVNEEVKESEAEKIAEKTTELEEKKQEKVEEVLEQPFDELENLLFQEDTNTKNDAKFIEELKTPTLEDELKDTLPVDVMADLFQKIEPQRTINDRLQHTSTVQIDLNDRIAFVKHLFNGDQNDFNRVVSQLNTFKTQREAKNFIQRMVKPDYDWSTKELYENRLLEIIDRRFS